jgi:transposase-like protein
MAFLKDKQFKRYFDMNITTAKLFYQYYLVYKESNKSTIEVATCFFEYFSYIHYNQILINFEDSEDFVWYVLQIADNMYEQYIDEDKEQAFLMALESVNVIRKFESNIDMNDNILKQWHIQALTNLAYARPRKEKHHLVDVYIKANHYYSEDTNEFIQGQLKLIQEYVNIEYGDNIVNKALNFLNSKDKFILDKRVKKLCDDVKQLFKDFKFNKGVSEDELKQFEKELFITLPNEFKTFLSTYNGIGEMKEYNFLSIQEIVEVWKQLIVRNNYPSYIIPFATNTSQDIIFYLDLQYFKNDKIYTVSRFDYGNHLEESENFTDWLDESIKNRFIIPKVLPTAPYFDNWNEYLDGEILYQCEENIQQTIDKLKQEKDKTKQIEIMKQCVERLNEFVKHYEGFIDIYIEEMCDVMDAIAEYYEFIDDKRYDLCKEMQGYFNIK